MHRGRSKLLDLHVCAETLEKEKGVYTHFYQCVYVILYNYCLTCVSIKDVVHHDNS